MIFDRNFPVDKLIQFLSDNDTYFTQPLSLVLQKQNMTIEAYSEKLSRYGTIACEFEENCGEIKGLVIGYTHNLPEDGGSYITQAVTGWTYRRQGVCKRLLKEYFAYCAEQTEEPVRYIWLTTSVVNYGAQTTYERVGFVKADSADVSKIRYIFSMQTQR